MVVPAENDTLFWLDTPKEAVPVGTVAGVQLPAVLKLPVPLRFQVASCAAAGSAAAISAEEASSAVRNVAPHTWHVVRAERPRSCIRPRMAGELALELGALRQPSAVLRCP